MAGQPSPILYCPIRRLVVVKNSLANNNFNFPFSVNLWFSSARRKNCLRWNRIAGFTRTESQAGRQAKHCTPRHPFTRLARRTNERPTFGGGWTTNGQTLTEASSFFTLICGFALSLYLSGCNCIFINLLNPLIKRILIFPTVYHLPENIYTIISSIHGQQGRGRRWSERGLSWEGSEYYHVDECWLINNAVALDVGQLNS